MISRFRRSQLAAFAGTFAFVSLAFSQSPASEAQNKLLAKRAAEADAYRKLAETVYGLQLSSNTFVRDFVTESDEIKTSVDALVRGVKLGEPRYYDDGVCEIDAEVTVEKVVTTLKRIHSEHYHGNRVTTTDFENIRKTIKRDVIQVTGMGAPRPELPPGLPYGVEDVITPLPSDYRPTLTVPEIWKSVTPQGRLMAERAAEVDAQRKLLERIMGLRLNSETLVRDFVTEYDIISTQAQGVVRGAQKVDKYLHTDELIVEVTMRVPVERVISTLKELHSQHYQGRRVTTTDFTQVRKQIQRDYFEATGAGVPSDRFLKSSGAPMTASVNPSWNGKPITVVGQGTDSDITTPQGKLRATEAARQDAARKLAEQINGLQIDAQTTVRDFLTESDVVQAQVNSVIAGASYDNPLYRGDGTVEVKATINGADVWGVVHSEMMIRSRG